MLSNDVVEDGRHANVGTNSQVQPLKHTFRYLEADFKLEDDSYSAGHYKNMCSSFRVLSRRVRLRGHTTVITNLNVKYHFSNC